mgnify:CR=1 FL=1
MPTEKLCVNAHRSCANARCTTVSIFHVQAVFACATITTLASEWNAFRTYEHRSYYEHRSSVVKGCSLDYNGLCMLKTKLCQRIFDSCVRPAADLNYGIHAHELYL